MAKKKLINWAILTVILLGLILPQHLEMPVVKANRSSYNQESFWYYPWGRSGTHKGVDIFAKAGTPVIAATPGIVLYSGEIAVGGKVVVILGPKWRLHYYAHLQDIQTSVFRCLAGSKELER